MVKGFREESDDEMVAAEKEGNHSSCHWQMAVAHQTQRAEAEFDREGSWVDGRDR